MRNEMQSYQHPHWFALTKLKQLVRMFRIHLENVVAQGPNTSCHVVFIPRLTKSKHRFHLKNILPQQMKKRYLDLDSLLLYNNNNHSSLDVYTLAEKKQVLRKTILHKICSGLQVRETGLLHKRFIPKVAR